MRNSALRPPGAQWSPWAAFVLLLPILAQAAEPMPSAPARLLTSPAREPPIRGQIRSSRHAVLSAGMAGELQAMPVDAGRVVKQGDVLAEFDCAAEQADHDMAQAKQQAARVKLSVNQRLSTAKNVSVLEVELSRSEVAMGIAELRRIDANLRHCTVHAPFSGMVVDRRVQAHEYVSLGTPLLELVDTSSLEIEMVVASQWIARLKPGTSFSLRVDETGQVAKAAVDRVVEVIDPVSQTLRIIGRLDEAASGLRPGMSGDVLLESPPNESLSR